MSIIDIVYRCYRKEDIDCRYHTTLPLIDNACIFNVSDTCTNPISKIDKLLDETKKVLYNYIEEDENDTTD